jgi:hypothetical protein
MPDLGDPVNDISSPRARRTRTRPRHNLRAPLVPTSSGDGVVGLHGTKRCPSFPTSKARHGISSYIVPKILSCFHPLARPSLPQARIQSHKGPNAVFSYVRDGGAVWSGMRWPLREYNITSASLDTLTSHESRPRQDIHPNSITLLSPNGLLTHRLNHCVIDPCPKRTVSLLLTASAFVKLHLPLAISLLILRKQP